LIDDARPPLRRAAPLLLLAALGGAYAALGPRLPHDHEVILELGDSASDLVALEVSWVSESQARQDGEAALTSEWHFAAGTAPRSLHTHARLANGSWELLATLERSDGARSEVRRTVELAGETLIVHLERAGGAPRPSDAPPPK
jgi:hypothetical protein